MPIGRVDHEGAVSDDENDYCHFDDDNPSVGARALTNSVNQKRRYGSDDEERRKIKGNRVTCDDWQGGGRITFQSRAALSEQKGGCLVIVDQPERKLQMKKAIA